MRIVQESSAVAEKEEVEEKIKPKAIKDLKSDLMKAFL